MNNTNPGEWLCRNCNAIVDADKQQCPHCNADRPEEVAATDILPEDIPQVVHRDGYSNIAPNAKAKYNFREGVLVNGADIILVLGIFCTIGALIAPMCIELPVENLRMWSVGASIAIFAIAILLWATLRTLADISRRMRNSDRQ
jgi:hypothetical protein